MKINFDINGMPEEPTIVLAYKDGRKIGKIKHENIVVKDNMANPNEISFATRKMSDSIEFAHWKDIVDFRLAWWKEADAWFEIRVSMDESNETIKHVLCVHLGEAELSQIKIYTTEINTESDISREDYKIPTIFYNPDHKEASLVHRIMGKAPHYEIVHVDDTLKDIQRTFAFDDESICDVFNTISDEIGCLVKYLNWTDANGKLRRGVAFYDLESNCKKCGHRGEFTISCPECSSTDIDEGYGEDTTIFITSDELADNVQFETQSDAVKNCFKLQAGDDLMTATIRNCNPNGTDYIWYISDAMKADMSSELREKLEEYDRMLKTYSTEYNLKIDDAITSSYNELIAKYGESTKTEAICNPIIGYSNLMRIYYDCVDLYSYLNSSMMPDVSMEETDAKKQAMKLTRANLSPVSTDRVDSLSHATADSIVLSMAKVIVNSRYKVKIKTSNYENLKWVGSFEIQNRSDEDDNAVSSEVEIEINDDYENFIRQKIDLTMKNNDADDVGIAGVFKLTASNFVNEIKKYCLTRLISFRDACQKCIDLLVEQGVSNGSLWENEEKDLYNLIYVPYNTKRGIIEDEIRLRENEIAIINGVSNIDGDIVSHGVKTIIDMIRTEIKERLDYETYLGCELWTEFCSFRRDEKYINENYISDGLNNAELFKMATSFFKSASNEIYKSAELQHCIRSTLRNLLMTPKFRALHGKFDTGNWVRIRIDDRVYKLRLISYQIDYGNLNNIIVEFSDVIKTLGGEFDQRSIMDKMISIASNYDGVKRQAEQGAGSNQTIKNWRSNGLDVSNTKIISSKNQTQTWDSNGMLFRNYDPVLERYDDEQMKIINSTIAITDDQWKSTKTAFGRVYYRDPTTGELRSKYGVNGEVLIGNMILGEELGIYNKDGSLKFDQNGLTISNKENTVEINPNSDSIFNIKNNGRNILSFDDGGSMTIVGNITAESFTLTENAKINGLSNAAVSGNYDDLVNLPSLSSVATSGSYNDLIDKPNYLASPTNTGSVNQYLSKTSSGSQWTSASTTIASNGNTPVSGSAVYNYALAKNQGASNAYKFLYTEANGDVALLTLEDLRIVLGL